MKRIIIILIVLVAVAGGGYLIFAKGIFGEKPDSGTKAANPVSVAAPNTPADDKTAALPAGPVSGAAPKNAADNKTAEVKSGALPEAIAEILKYQYTEKYLNSNHGFSFKYPKDFTVNEMPDGGNEVILVQNIAKNIGLQIFISPFDGGEIDITAQIVQAEIPNLKINEPQAVLVGPNRRGLAFMSDNEAFGGASREVWFVFNNNLYQISTYAELDGFLKGLFGTWSFQ